MPKPNKLLSHQFEQNEDQGMSDEEDILEYANTPTQDHWLSSSPPF